jgi:hypothetical protein
MEKQKTTFAKFTKQKMIDDINSLRKKTMQSQVVKTDIAQTYQTLYNYKVVDKLIELGFLKLSEKKGKSSYYKWNFDTKVDLELSDALYVNVLVHRRNLTRKYAEHKIIKNNKKELIESQQQANLQVEEPILEPTQEIASSSFDLSYTKIWIGNNKELSERVQEKAFQLGWGWNLGGKTIKNTDADSLYFSENLIIDWCKLGKSIFSYNTYKEIFESDLFPEVKEEKQLPRLKKMSFSQQLMSPDELARDLGLVPSEEEIEGWKKEIEYLKDELKNEKEALTRQQTANKSYKKRIFETEENLNQSLKIIKAQNNTIQGYENSLNSQKVSAESYKKRFEDAQKSLDEAKKVINEQEIAIEFFKQKKPFKSIKPKIEPKQVKYFKLFGYTIYEKN